MITEHDLKAAIAECQGKKNPDANTCIKLAAFYTIYNEMFGEGKKDERSEYAYASAPGNVIEINSGSEFAGLVNGRVQEDVMPVIDELMETLKVVLPKLYNAVILKLS